MAKRRRTIELKRDPPENVKRKLRREGKFGCLFCGCPIIQYHHIIPWEEEHHHNPKHMAILCPKHHYLADNKTIPRDEIYRKKKDPFNRKNVGDLFEFKSRHPGLIVGNNAIYWFSEIIRFDDYVALGISIAPQGYLLINSKRYDKNGKIILEIVNNEWKVPLNNVWDILYKGKLLKIWDKMRDVGFELQYLSLSDQLLINGKFEYKDRIVRINKNGITDEKRNIRFSNLVISSDDRKSLPYDPKKYAILRATYKPKTAIYVTVMKDCKPNTCLFKI